MAAPPLILDGRPLSIEDVRSVAARESGVTLDPRALDAVRAARAVVAKAAEGPSAVYGVNTGFGSLSQVRIDPAEVRAVQRNLVRSHAAGVGEPLDHATVRAMLLILAASLMRGRSGVRVEVIELLVGMLERDVIPVVPSRGSVGASGDLAPLAHVALTMIGEGEAWHEGARQTTASALRAAGLDPVELMAKEGLALINGTHLMAARAALVLADVRRLLDAAVTAAAMAIDGCRATDAFLDQRLYAARPHRGGALIAAALSRTLAGSTILPAHRADDPRVQDPYSLRAAPTVLGAVLETIEHVESIVRCELGAVTDNPLVFPDSAGGEAIISGANFHGMPLAIALDTLTIALSHLAGIAERRIYWLLKASDGENPVNTYLSPKPGLHSGLMIVQYTAAACVNEIQTLATPASVGNIPTSAGMEDYNSMGATSAHQAHAAVRLARSVIAAELLVMAEALEYQRPLRSGAAVEAAHARIRAVVGRLTEDRPPAPDLAEIERLIADDAFAGALE